MKYSLPTSVAIALAVASPAFPQDITLLGAADYDWERTPEGVSFAPLQGNRFTGSYQALVELPAGTVSPPHVKSANMYGVMLQGEMIHYLHEADPAAAQKMGRGSFYSIPAGLPHVSACVSDIPCIVYLYQDGAFDFVPVAQ